MLSSLTTHLCRCILRKSRMYVNELLLVVRYLVLILLILAFIELYSSFNFGFYWVFLTLTLRVCFWFSLSILVFYLNICFCSRWRKRGGCSLKYPLFPVFSFGLKKPTFIVFFLCVDDACLISSGNKCKVLKKDEFYHQCRDSYGPSSESNRRLTKVE